MKNVDVLCKSEVSSKFYAEHRRWLDEKKGRRLFFIEERAEIPEEEDLIVLKNDRRVKIFHIESPLQEEGIAMKIGRLAAFKELLVLDEKWRSLIEPHHLAANLITSDASEFGVRVSRHLKKNLQTPVRSFVSLKNAMAGVPAIVVGAGPSLEKNEAALKHWQRHGLIIAAGSAIEVLNVEPDLGVAIDAHTPLLRRKFPHVPLAFQGRVHPDSLRKVRAEKLYVPDSHFLFEPWLTGHEIFNSGWTVGNAAVAMAVHLGCDPIILVGMDYCYRNQKKYAGQKANNGSEMRIPAVDAKGQPVETQRDWLLAIAWMKEFAAKHPQHSWINATVDGMEIGAPFVTRTLDEIEQGPAGVTEKWNAALSLAPFIELAPAKSAEWKESLKRCKEMGKNAMEHVAKAHDVIFALPQELHEEIAYELLLKPLWQIWEPIFERELMADSQPISMEQKLQIQRVLFFQQIVDDHLHV